MDKLDERQLRLRLLWDFKDWLLRENDTHIPDRWIDEFLVAHSEAREEEKDG